MLVDLLLWIGALKALQAEHGHCSIPNARTQVSRAITALYAGRSVLEKVLTKGA